MRAAVVLIVLVLGSLGCSRESEPERDLAVVSVGPLRADPGRAALIVPYALIDEDANAVEISLRICPAVANPCGDAGCRVPAVALPNAVTIVRGAADPLDVPVHELQWVPSCENVAVERERALVACVAPAGGAWLASSPFSLSGLGVRSDRADLCP